MSYCQDLLIHCHPELIRADKMNTFYPYKLAKLVHYEYSNSKNWYIDFAAYSVQTGKLKRKRISEFNNIVDLEKRRKYAENLVIDINNMLVKGYHFDTKKAEALKIDQVLKQSNSFLSCEDALKLAEKKREKDYTERTRKDVKSKIKLFKGWLSDKGVLYDSIKTIGAREAREYIYFLQNSNDFTNITVNNHIRALKALFEFFKDNEIVSVNIFRDIKKKKEVRTSRNLAYTDEQAEQIKKYFAEKDPEVWQFCEFIFYSFMRPVEIRSLTWGDVFLDEKYIYLCAESSKVKKERFVQITNSFRELILKIRPVKAGKDDFIFPSKKRGARVAISNNYYSEKYREGLKQLGFSNDYTMYSWKHTGNVKAYKQGVGIHAIMRQNGHTQMQTTVNYLKSLGILLDTEFTEKMNDVKI